MTWRKPMTWRNLSLAALLAAVLSGCPSYTLLSDRDQQAILGQYRGASLYLRQPVFVGPFFNYDDRLLISERSFEERTLVEDLDGKPILPPDPTGILPLGARVRIRDVEFPTGRVVADRNLKSPRQLTWVLLEAERQPKPLVLVLTQDLTNPARFKQVLEQFLAHDDPRSAFQGRPPEILAAIDRKIAVPGMRIEELLASRGRPEFVTREVADGVRVERWNYGGKRFVILKDDRVASFEGFKLYPFQASAPEPAPAGGGS